MPSREPALAAKRRFEIPLNRYVLDRLLLPATDARELGEVTPLEIFSDFKFNLEMHGEDVRGAAIV